MAKKTIKESADKKHLYNFVNNMFNKDYANANANLNLAVREKLKARVQNILKEIE